MLPVAEGNIFNGSARAIFYHKTPASGKTCFLQQENGQVCGFTALPKLSQIIDPGDKGYSDDISMHPSVILKNAAEILGIPQQEMEMDSEFCEKIDVAGNCLSVYLIRFKSIDPPAQLTDNSSKSFISITEARNLAPLELELLRRAYCVIMEG